MSTVTRKGKLLILIFLLSLPLCNPWVRGDGVGYYAYARSLLIEHHLKFERDWEHGNDTFRSGRIDSEGRVLVDQYTVTGHINNAWTIGPSLLWLPFLFLTHMGVLLCNHLGTGCSADGFSPPYLITMAVSTALYGFGALWISFCLARRYFQEQWAFVAAIAVWGASSLPVYMYFNPSWSHAHSAFVVALFLWYWDQTRMRRTRGQWVLLGLISGLTVDVYYPNGVLLLIPLMETLPSYWQGWKRTAGRGSFVLRLLATHIVYVAVCAVALLPTFISRYIIFGGILQTGYPPAAAWNWKSPSFWNVLFASNHGLLSWTPVLVPALVGIILFFRKDRFLAASLVVVFISFCSVIASYPHWDHGSSFGNRFFVSLTAVFVLGLASALDQIGQAWQSHRAAVFVVALTGLMIVWNWGLIFQWGTHLIPARGPISWRAVARNQLGVPAKVTYSVEDYFLRRGHMMHQIETEDAKQLAADAQE